MNLRAFSLCIFLVLAPATGRAAGEPGRCARWYAALRDGVKDSLVGSYEVSRDTARQILQLYREEGALRLFVRDRSAEEQAARYRDYFVVAPPTSEISDWRLVNLYRDGRRRLHPVLKYAPVQGAILSLDRLFLRQRTTTAGAKGLVLFAAGTGAAIAAQEYLYEEPMSYLEMKLTSANAVAEGLDHAYEFADLRAKMAAGELSREEAEKLVRNEFSSRALYHSLVSLAQTAAGKEHPERLFAALRPYLNDPRLADLFQDVRYYLGPEFAQNPTFLWENGVGPRIDADTATQLIQLNHARILGLDLFAPFESSHHRARDLPLSDPLRQTYEEFRADPFRRKLVEYQARHPDKVSARELDAWISEDIEWTVRFSALKLLGAGMRKKPGSAETLRLEDRRAYFLKKNKIRLD